MRYVFLVAVAALALTATAFGRWGAGVCVAVAAPEPERWSGVRKVESYSWQAHPDAAGQWVLFRGNSAVGLCRGGTYWPWDGSGYGPPCASPVALPAAARAVGDLPPTGVVWDKIKCQDGKCRYTINGREVTEQAARQAIAAGKLTDDSGLLRVTIIGTDADRKRVEADLESNPQLAALKGKLLVQSLPPDHWHLDVGFKKDGKPTIYVQAPSGKVLHRQDDYGGGAEKLAEAIRKADPSYDPAKDPDLRKPAPEPVKPPAPPPAPEPDRPLLNGILEILKNLPGWVWAVVLLGGAWLLARVRETKP